MIRILIGLILALSVAAGVLFWQLGETKEQVVSVREDNDRLIASLADALDSYERMAAAKDQSIDLLISRGHDREERIAKLAEQSRRIAAIPDDDCLGRVMPGDAIRLLEGTPSAGAGGDPHVSASAVAAGLSKASAAGRDLSRSD